jgi:hypothetical protein
MASRNVWTKDETMHLISFYESCREICDSRQVHYKDRQKGIVLAINGRGAAHHSLIFHLEVQNAPVWLNIGLLFLYLYNVNF